MTYHTLTKEFNNKFWTLAENSKSIAITAHFSPDGDSISSCLSVFRILKDKFSEKNIRVIYSGEEDASFRFLSDFKNIEWLPDMADGLAETDLLIVVDCADDSRFTNKPEITNKITSKICIDHHKSAAGGYTENMIVPEIPACAELIYRIFKDEIIINEDLAKTFLLGIITDTGNFTDIEASQADTLLVANELIKKGNVNMVSFLAEFGTISKREFELVQEFIKNSSFEEVLNWPPFHYTYIEREIIEKNNYTGNELNKASKAYISAYLKKIEGYQWGFIVRPKLSFCGISMRSVTENVNVRKILERMELGGGHDRAAGGIFKDEPDPKKCIERVFTWLENNKPE
ncbi:MAG: DHH family phosphoesterase [Candidatus Paceibacterota bacterium]